MIDGGECWAVILARDDLYHDIDDRADFNRIEKLFLARKGLTNGTPIHAEVFGYPD